MPNTEELDIPVKPVTPVPPTVLEPPTFKPPFLSPERVATAPVSSQKKPEVRADEIEASLLIIGHDTSFSGQISACKRLLVEGKAEAKLEKCQEIEITETGFLKGQASTENAEVRGRFEGEFTVKKRLLIRAGGQVYGSITYGEIEIERGGRLGGTATDARKGAGQNGSP